MNKNKSLPSLKRFKQRAKSLKNILGIELHQAYEQLSQSYGFSSWYECKSHYDRQDSSTWQIAEVSHKYVPIDEAAIAVPEAQEYDEHVEANKRFLTKLAIEYSVFEPTVTGLKKSILDATFPVRSHFRLEGFHDYSEQQQGSEHKVIKSAQLLGVENCISSKLSLYRPKTKKGDPRMWFRKLGGFALAGDIIAIIVIDDCAYLLNLSQSFLEGEFKSDHSHVGKHLRTWTSINNRVAEELLAALKKLAVTPFKAERKGDTAIGYTLESLLGIEANSSKKPDYKGIELKSGRGNRTRTTLFAQVADWRKSTCKRSAEILERYGYTRDNGDFKLYCTVSATKPNSQGLYFKYDYDCDWLEEVHNSGESVATWPSKLLEERLLEKHSETFWIEADSWFEEGVEYFHLRSLVHTKAPILTQLIPLIIDGKITMDHLIKRSGKTDKVSEKGPLFKINKRDLSLLFPEPIHHCLKTEV
ncbi:MvaI/BcnI family restriction endonuclease [Ferrimonas lipolytica]|uniref:MvaI/BcnI restriction endonuclease domain-containing protein n=1 Tax=Ferrimonas lipolytica TaxID=2724191 RepID=A0A6H1UGC6_9GAMM|nr:MvaI/BcnI family restriction endonuclease [Ferrimonas lipolytica]QIZ77266.1 hypothetical protein HER31_10475 [Ferrimonas lipolytica]